MKLFWMLGGFLALGLALLGIPLPFLPTVPFLLLAGFCFARSSERMHAWLVTHPRLGPPIQDWAANGAISRMSKVMATIMMTASLLLTWSMGLALTVVALQLMVLAAVSVFIWSRPEA